MKKLFLLIPALFFAAVLALAAQTTQPTAVLQYFDNPSQFAVPDAGGNNANGVSYGMDLGPGYQIKTGNSTAEIQLDPNGSILKLAYNTNFTIQTLQGNSNQNVNAFSLLAGRLRAIAAHAPGANDAYSIQTPTAVCGVRGTDFTLDVVPGKTDAVGVLNGVVNFVDTSSGQSLNVTAGNFANTFASVFQAVKMTSQQMNQLFTQMSFTKLNPTSVPGHTAEKQPAQTESQPPTQPTQPTPAQQTESSKPRPEGPLMKFLSNNLGMQIGTITIDGTTYSKAVLQPHFTLGRLKMGLYLPVIYQSDLFNPSTWYRPAGNNEWNFGTGPGFSSTWQRVGDAASDLMLKIQYVEWGQQRDPFFFKVGNLNDLTIGHGLLMYNYVNNEDFPAIRKVGFDLGIDFNSFGFQTVVDNLANPQIFGGRLYVRPFGKGFLKPALGVSAVADINPSANLTAAQTTQYGDPIFIAFGPDLDLPFIDTHNLSIVAFADLGGMMPYYRDAITGAPAGLYTQALFDTSGGSFKLRNYGFASGLLGNVFGLQWRLEYRNFDGIFQPAMFNSTYNRNRGQDVINMANYVADPSNPAYQSSTMGIYGQAGMTVGKYVDFVAGYFWPWSSATTFQAGDNDYLHLALDLKRGFIPGFGIGASLAYDRTDFIPTLLRGSSSGLSLFDANTTVKAELDYPIAPTLDLALIYTTAVVHNADGTVKQDPNNPNLPDVAGSVSIETRIHF